MNQDEQGAWVLHSEVEALKAQYEEQIGELNREIDELKDAIRFWKDRSDYYDKQASKEYTEKLHYQFKLELIGNFATVLTIAGVIGCLVYSFGY